MNENSVRVVARITAKPGSEDELRTILSSMLEPVRQEEGCITYEMLENRSDPTDFTLVEEWASEETLASHLEGLQSNLPGLMPLLSEPPDVRTYSMIL
jgi:quinol monooxygenase YgiN